MVYSMALCLTARWCRVPAFVHHHSASYLGDKPEMKMKFLCRISGDQAQHLVGCELTAAGLLRLYGDLNFRILPICFAVDVPLRAGADTSSARTHQHEAESRPEIRVGHLSNLSIEKGLVAVFDTVDTLATKGLAVTLVLAGPPASEADDERLQALLTSTQHRVEYLGPVYGHERERFFNDIDVFLFPSRYRHESFGLVAGEALSRRVPVVAYTSGCLTADLVGTAGRILPQTANFPREAAAWIQRIVSDPQRWAEAVEGTVRFARACETARNLAREAAADMVTGVALRSGVLPGSRNHAKGVD